MEFTAAGGERLDKFLATMLPDHSRTKLARLIEDGLVLVDGVAQKPGLKLVRGQVVSLDEVPSTPAHDLSPADIPLEIPYEDDYLLVVNKPRGLATHPAVSLKEPSLVNALLGRSTSLSTGSEEYRPGIVHRLDKDTTGLLVVAKRDDVHVKLARQIAGKTADRRYLAVVAGIPDQERFTISAPISRDKVNRQKMAVDPHGKSAVTHVKVLGKVAAGCVLALKLETGRTHQIRVHLRAIGHPVLGDRIYAPTEFASGVLQLHAAYLAFIHPVSRKRVALYQPPPEDFLAGELAGREAVEQF